MKLVLLAIATLAIVGVFAAEGALSDNTFVGGAAASCIIDPINDSCLTVCPAIFQKLHIECTQ